MKSYEAGEHSFIVRIWLEEIVQDTGRTVWRGSITHVPSGRQRYMQDLDQVATFMMSYLQEMGVKFGLRQRLKQWFAQRAQRRT
jgi:hypothetical protein